MRVAVIGQGYVGLPLAIAAAEAGHEAIGVDLSALRVNQLNEASSPVGDVTDAQLRAAIEAGRYRATSDYADVSTAEVVVICVPTPYREQAPDLSYIESAGRGIGPHLQRGTCVILESTTYPGTTEELLQPILEETSGLVAGGDFELVFSPERINPGDESFGIHNTPKIVGGLTEAGTNAAAAFYGSFVETVVRVSGPKSAEMAKLLENTFRHINIALVNELAILCRDLDVDVWEVIDAAASKPFGFMPFYPGPGVGGHCIPVDPMYLSWRVKQFGGSAKFIDLARDVNAAMPAYCVTRVQDLLNEREKPLKGSRLLVLGVAYKPGISDMRESPALFVLEALRQKGAEVEYADPHVPRLTIEDVEMVAVDLDEEKLAAADCVIVLTGHAEFDFEWIARSSQLVFDTRNVMPRGVKHVHRL